MRETDTEKQRDKETIIQIKRETERWTMIGEKHSQKTRVTNRQINRETQGRQINREAKRQIHNNTHMG